MRAMGAVLWVLVSWVSVAFAAKVRVHRSVWGDRPLTGRVFLFVAKGAEVEPRRGITPNQDTEQFFGKDVHNWVYSRDGPVVFTDQDLGYPRSSLSEMDDMFEYRFQVVFQPYEKYDRKEPVWLPSFEANKHMGGGFSIHPGVLYSIPEHAVFNASGANMEFFLRFVQGREQNIDSKNDTKYIKHVSVKSELLTKFWGRDIYIDACVLVPYGFDEHPQARYPLMLYHGHFHPDFATPNGFSEHPPDDSLKGYDRVSAEYAYRFYKNWTNPNGGPFHKNRVLIVTLKHANPYFDDSYAVNSENLGPYGDAIMDEVLPKLEHQFRGISKGWARATYGGSTGGWVSLASQIMYPDSFNGCYSSCPDPIAFQAYTTVNIYNDTNAYWLDSPWKRTLRAATRGKISNLIYPGFGSPNEIVTSTQQEQNQMELVTGTLARSGGQWDIWQAVFGPRDKSTGHVIPIWDKKSGVINKTVAGFWRDNYDLAHIIVRDWHKLAPKLQGKIHLSVGIGDTYYLNNAVYAFEDALKTLDPPAEATFTYGSHDGRVYAHCYGGQEYGVPNSIARLLINARIVPRAVQRMVDTAPIDADVTSWRY
uniref:Esterase n=2 Tax=Mucochytrium quahogii TaxID=96639 RepID=A0A7S2RA87_9STRA|mmetsp:Transcript_44225/g.70687  ORF Transcript_44225/g.70687 Transcript_44225/m.70687 type:complete len:591 (+) Transcript_44225:204-1976(+)|eukprot:CAMPEP_0203760068 /NCGR_PEP_ID=MMETSP0098-20131031/13454_1 /ASSEMBLY_ACC=CAM_ASM_000208 /TAXON_ID=96639 /ORGANISM=" , Strain NY0313808BC1" /LENGTH=590 /DNA_ID=CAMNT_0050653511 /DNA_START=124 /DNA_END=1896 /DNA_ORIENTATION=-